MRTITKSNSPPACLAGQPQNQPWSVFASGPCHGRVADALIEEQQYLCCYCESEIKRSNGHIEHMEPRSLAPNRRYDYSNLASSCNGGTGRNRHCGPYKGNKYDAQLFSPPHDPHTASLFHYHSDGKIAPARGLSAVDQEKARHMIVLLNLNCPGLMRRRKAHFGIIVNTLSSNPDQGSVQWAKSYYLQTNLRNELKGYFSISEKVIL